MNSEERRQRIMNSDLQLPGDAKRAEDEANGDFDSLDTGNFDAAAYATAEGSEENRQAINEDEAQLPGDAQRAADDHRIDQYGVDAPDKSDK